MKVFFYAPKHLDNLAAIIRTLEVFGIREMEVFDEFGVVKESENKVLKRKLNKISSGSFQYMKFNKHDDPEEFLKNYPGRKIATVLKNQSSHLTEFTFLPDDILLLGNETRGLPEDVISLCDVKLKIPQVGKTESLNLGIAAGIFIYENFKQRRG